MSEKEIQEMFNNITKIYEQSLRIASDVEKLKEDVHMIGQNQGSIK